MLVFSCLDPCCLVNLECCGSCLYPGCLSNWGGAEPAVGVVAAVGAVALLV